MPNAQYLMPNAPFLGAHVSISGGVEKSPERGRLLTCDCIQIFSKNQNQWKSKPLTEKNIRGFKEGIAKHDTKAVLIHDSYLINLCSPDQLKLLMSINAFVDEIERAEQLGVGQITFHPGSHMSKGEDWGLAKIAESLNRIMEKKPNSTVKLLLETTAGQGSNLGYRFEHFAEIIAKVEDKSRMGVCFDTAHAFAAGFNLRTREDYDAVWKNFDDIIGLDRLQAFHLNDSKKAFKSRVDRHEHIGQGLIGLEAFRLLLNDPKFYSKGMYLETPQGDDEYLRNLKVLRGLLENV